MNKLGKSQLETSSAGDHASAHRTRFITAASLFDGHDAAAGHGIVTAGEILEQVEADVLPAQG